MIHSPASTMFRITRYSGGEVWVGGQRLAERPRGGIYLERLIASVRERTSDEWWQRAAEVHDAQTHLSTGGPLGLGVDFFAWELDALIDEDARDAIQHDAYEAAREAIVEGINAHLQQMIPAVTALGRCCT